MLTIYLFGVFLSLPKPIFLKKDLRITKVTQLQLAVVHNYNPHFKTNDWNVYLINMYDTPIEMVLIVTKGQNKKLKTAALRHKVAHMPAHSVAKIELLIPEVLTLDNSFKISFFKDDKLFEKDFLIKKNTISVAKAQALTLFNKQKGYIYK